MIANNVAGLVFFLTLAATYSVAILARLKNEKDTHDEQLAGRKLNRWMIGLSAGTTGNSGFIITGAVALGYVGGIQWLLFPIAWLLGDLIFWSVFPQRLNKVARIGKVVTLSELLTLHLKGTIAKLIVLSTSVLLGTFLATYTAAQWLAGKKFLSGAFGLTDFSALSLFALSIIGYSSLGGFRGSVYTDVVQAIIRILGTLIALGTVIWYAVNDVEGFTRNISSTNENFFNLFPNGAIATLGFFLGYAMAAIGFGLGQPQIASRYMAGRNPGETRAAWWIYIGFIQFTWIAMTSFGVILRGVMPNLHDPETGLSLFFQQYAAPLITGIVFADVFATIASTSNGILVSITQIIQRDFLSHIPSSRAMERWLATAITFLLGLITIALSLVLSGSVFTIAIDAVSKIGAGLAGPVMIKVLGVKHTSLSLLFAILSGIFIAFVWSYAGYDKILNEAGVGIACSLLVNALVFRLFKKMSAAQ